MGIFKTSFFSLISNPRVASPPTVVAVRGGCDVCANSGQLWPVLPQCQHSLTTTLVSHHCWSVQWSHCFVCQSVKWNCTFNTLAGVNIILDKNVWRWCVSGDRCRQWWEVSTVSWILWRRDFRGCSDLLDEEYKLSASCKSTCPLNIYHVQTTSSIMDCISHKSRDSFTE